MAESAFPKFPCPLPSWAAKLQFTPGEPSGTGHGRLSQRSLLLRRGHGALEVR